ncbi:MAG: hypothetical protein QXK98_06400 [Candidatus Bathyarchaeia archaeon]
MIAEFCDWCREYLVNKNLECRICESCLKCQHFDGSCCLNEIVVARYKADWHRPNYVKGIGPPLCRKYCPFLYNKERMKAAECAGN